MKIQIAIFAALFVATAAHGQSAPPPQSACPPGYEYLCKAPTTPQRPSDPQSRPAGCDQACQDHNREVEEHNRKVDEQRREYKEKLKQQNAEQKTIEKANKIAAKAWELLDKGNCDKAIPLYREALALTAFSPWQQNIGYCYQQLKQPVNAILEYRKVYADPTTSPENQKRVRWQMWSLLYDLGYECPDFEDRPSHDGKTIIKAYPVFKGYTDGCVGVPSKIKEPTYVPMPYIEGKTWFPINYAYVGDFYAITRDGHRWGPGDDLRKANLLNARIVTGDRAGMRFTLPDGHDFVMGANSDITFDSFVYNPNTSLTEIVVENIKGLFRIVTATLQKPEPQGIKVKLPVGDLGGRGTDIVVNQDKGLWGFFNYEGTVTFTKATNGVVFEIPPGQVFSYRQATGDVDIFPIRDILSREPLIQTDSWNMTPVKK